MGIVGLNVEEEGTREWGNRPFRWGCEDGLVGEAARGNVYDFASLFGEGEGAGLTRPIVRDCRIYKNDTQKEQRSQLTVPGVLLAAARRRARWAVPGPVDEPGFFFGDAGVRRAERSQRCMLCDRYDTLTILNSL